MNIKILLFRHIVLLGLLSLAVSGCSVLDGLMQSEDDVAVDNSGDVVAGKAPIDVQATSRSFKLPITSVPSGKVYFRKYKAIFDGKELIITGKIRNRHHNHIVGGHVDVSVYNADDSLLHKTSVYQLPKTLHGIGSKHNRRGSRFQAKIVGESLPEDSRVVIWFHRRSSDRNRLPTHSAIRSDVGNS